MKVLIADDDSVARLLLDATMRQLGYTTVLCADGEAAWTALTGVEVPQLVLLDWHMPGIEGVEICRRIRSRGASPYVYVILVSGKTLREDIIEGLDAGADDYITKPIDLDEFRVRVRAGRRILELQAALLAAGEKLRDLASRDPLTGLLNRTAILAALDREVERAAREHRSVGVVMLDIDHFKRINDASGHLAGDAALRAVSTRLEASLRSYDVAGRYGGEEFLVVLPGCSAADAMALAEQMRQGFAAEPFDTPEGRIGITISAGVATATAGTSRSGLELVRDADEALYRAKRAGRNRVAAANIPAGV